MTTIASTIAATDEWRQIPGFPSYQVTTDGKVRRARGCRGYFAGKLLKPKTSSRGYYYYDLCENGNVTRLIRAWCIAFAYIGTRPEGAVIRHLDGVKTNDHALNLRWGTNWDNAQDRIEHGVSPRGERNGQAKLTEEDVRQIREIASVHNPSHQALALLFEVKRMAIGKILRGERWSHI